jgi:hypothetical protein
MDNKTQPSFIPKKPVGKEFLSNKSKVSILGVISAVIFIITIAGAVGLFLYKGFLKSDIASMQNQLAKARATFNPLVVQDLTRLTLRIDTARKILDTHISTLAIFDLLQHLTLKTVRFKSFNYVYSNEGVISLTMQGEGASFNSVALQSDILRVNPLLDSPIFTNLVLAEDSGNVQFNFTAKLNNTVARYKNGFKGATSTGEKLN